MACGGCRRNKKTSVSRIKSKLKTKITKSAPLTTSSTISSMLINRKKKCSRCPFNTIIGLSGRCKKTNRMISRAISDPSFKCPIKRF